MDENREIHDEGDRPAGSGELSDELAGELREAYNPPPDTPRDEMWAVIEAGLAPRHPSSAPAHEVEVVSLQAERVRRRPTRRRVLEWAVAAAALLVVGVGIGRMSVRPSGGTATMASVTPNPAATRVAAVEHLGRTESLLAVVQADARTGRLDPQVGAWARDLLSQTRLLLDAHDERDPAMRQLLEDLELVLVQIVGITDAGPQDTARTRTELNLTLRGLQERDVLPRIQAVVPTGSPLSGTD